MNKVTEISVEELKKKLKSNEKIFLLDVREPYEFEEGHIKGSVNIPLGFLGVGIIQKSIPKDKEVITICMHGRRSLYARNELSLQGYRVFSLFGGFEAWLLQKSQNED